MHQSIPTISAIGFTALLPFAYDGNAVSHEAQVVRENAVSVLKVVEESEALFGAKAEAISQLMAVAAEEKQCNPDSVFLAERFVRVLPAAFPMPEFSMDPDGSISLDWIPSRARIFSVSVSQNSRLAFAWVDGTDRGHAVARFDGQQIPKRVLEGIASIYSFDQLLCYT